MVSGHLSPPVTASQPLQAQEGSEQLAGTGCATPDSWQKEREEMLETVQILEKHKDWADKKIGQLIKRVTEAERPQKDEAYRLRDEVRQIARQKHKHIWHDSCCWIGLHAAILRAAYQSNTICSASTRCTTYRLLLKLASSIQAVGRCPV